MGDDFQSDIDTVGRIDAVPRILDVVCRTTGMGFAAVARVTENRWIACQVRDEIAFGLKPGSELKVETTICHEIRQNGEPVVIDRVAEDTAYCRHPMPAMYGFQSYISMPIVLQDGTFFGTLLAIDPKPAHLNTPATIGMFKLFAELIAFHLDAVRRGAENEARQFGEHDGSELGEQFIAVLGHDLRNPLAAIGSGTRLLLRTPLNDQARDIIGLMQNSVGRMSGLIDNILDFAHGRLGSGLPLSRNADVLLEPVLSQVADELRVARPDRTIETKFALDRPISCDPIRIGQLFSNLLGNALTHGEPDKPVRADASIEEGRFELSVANAGNPIPPETFERLFQPFARGTVKPNQQGLGLGLYIASEIARAHGGRIDVVSTPEETRFTFRMPA